MLRKILLMILGLALLILFAACGGTGVNTDGPDNLEASGIISMPSCLVVSNPGSRAVDASGISGEFYGSIRVYLGVCDNLAQMAKEFIEGLPAVLPDVYEGILEEGSDYYLVLGASPVEGYTHRFEIYTDDTKKTLAVRIDMDKDMRAKGDIILNSALDPTNIGGTFQVSYDGTVDPKTMSVYAEGFAPDDNSSITAGNKWDLESIFIEVTKSGDDLTVSGSSYHPYAGEDVGDDEWFNEGEGRYYCFRGYADVAEDKAVVEVGIPSETDSVTEENIFDDFSIGSLFSEIMAEQLRNDPTAGQFLVNFTQNPLVDATLDIELSSPEDITAKNLPVILTAFKQVLDSLGQTNSDIEGALFILELDNPVFFDASGYVSNGTDAEDIPEGYPELGLLDANIPKTIPAELVPIWDLE